MLRAGSGDGGGVLCAALSGFRAGPWAHRAGQCGVWCPGSPLSLRLPSVCSSPPIHMKVQPLNQTALQVSWSRPETVYHPPIMNYMISYSWTKNEDEKEKTFTKDSDKDLVKVGVPAALAGRRGTPATSLPGTAGRPRPHAAAGQWLPVWTMAEPAWTPSALTFTPQGHLEKLVPLL